MTDALHVVWAWGFTPAELAEWPPDLRPQALSALPPELGNPLVVHARAAADFAQAAATVAGGARLPEAILFGADLTPVEPALAIQYFDRRIAAGDWRQLRAALEELPVLPLLEETEDLAIRELGERADEANDATLLATVLPMLSPTHQAAIAADARLQHLLLADVRQRIDHWRQIVTPPASRRLAYARQPVESAHDAWVTTYLAANPAAAAAVRQQRRAAFRTAQARQPLWSTWRVGVFPGLEDARALLDTGVAAGQAGLASLAATLMALVDGGLQPAPASARHRADGVSVGADFGLESYLDDLLAIGAVDLYTNESRPTLSLTWNGTARVLEINLISPFGEPRPRLRLDLEWGEEAHPFEENAEGIVLIPLDVLQQAAATPGARISLWLAVEEPHT